MLFPNEAKQIIADTFYDKKVEVLSSAESIDSEGGLVKASETVKSTFKGNVRFLTYGEKQSDKGLLQDIDVIITCPTTIKVDNNTLLRYNGTKLVIAGVIDSDSHKEIQAKKWAGQ